MRNLTTIVLAILALLAGVYILDGIDLPIQSRLGREFTNAGHAPLFGVLSIAVLILTKAWFTRWRKPYSHFIFAGLTTAGLGFATEVVQYFTHRDASLLDMVYNLIGIASFLLFAATFDFGLRGLPILNRLSGRNIVRLFSLLILSTAFIAFAVMASAHAHRKAQFPVILDFESLLDNSFIEASNASVDFVTAPEPWEGSNSSVVCKWTIQPGALSSLTVMYPSPVWSGYNFLQLEIFSSLTDTIRVSIRINDVLHNFEYEDRFNTVLEVKPGLNLISLPLSEIENAPSGRKMDMTSIANIILFTTIDQSARVLFIDNIRLK